ncbi:hypothetical protein [Rubripirellula reticaptiva]|uniref:Uncharacterized protein n=1 Tax=Rubripirellula reticaptiva TaxID=2528013 RepID=A0A5C6EPU8_9BACT|nr:hypothetical protein [Rubripirellula reticaptiva]TWU49616.1 hypothetical protein Poly59_42380 [Rubripirellula reticaptiva]
MEKKFKAKDKIAKRAVRKLAIENGTFHAQPEDDSSEDDEANMDD